MWALLTLPLAGCTSDPGEPSSAWPSTPSETGLPSTVTDDDPTTPSVAGEAVVRHEFLTEEGREIGHIATAMDAAEQVHVLYWDTTGYDNYTLFHLRPAGGTRELEPIIHVEDLSGWVSAAFGPDGVLHASFLQRDGGADGFVAYGARDTTGWVVDREVALARSQMLGGASIGIYADTSIAVDGDGIPAILFLDVDDELLVARPGPGGWAFDSVEPERFGIDPNGSHWLGIDDDGELLALFNGYDEHAQDRTFAATPMAQGWAVEQLLEEQEQLHPPVFDDDGVAHLAYVEARSDAPISTITGNPGAWSLVDIAPEPPADDAALALDAQGRLHLVYTVSREIFGEPDRRGVNWWRLDEDGWVSQMEPYRPAHWPDDHVSVNALALHLADDGVAQVVFEAQERLELLEITPGA